jgi:hypothetical protein
MGPALPRGSAVPQNVNFATRREVVSTYLSTQLVPPQSEKRKEPRALTELADDVKKSVYAIECR